MTANLPDGAFLCQYSRMPIWLDQEIGNGGEGRVYNIVKERHLVAKMYHHPSEEYRVKLAAMMLNKPMVYHLKSMDMIAWPVDGLVNEQGDYVGFLMPLVERKCNVALSQVYNPRDRYKTVPEFTWRDLLSIAAHIANVITVLHASSYVVGDINESNILVNTKTRMVTLVDCDSIQVPGTDGEKFRCSVGK